MPKTQEAVEFARGWIKALFGSPAEPAKRLSPQDQMDAVMAADFKLQGEAPSHSLADLLSELHDSGFEICKTLKRAGGSNA